MLVCLAAAVLLTRVAHGQCNGNCGGANGQGHATTYSGGTPPNAFGVDYPYTEDIVYGCTTGYHNLVLNYDPSWSSDASQGFAKIWTGCATWNETNINASGAVNVTVHASTNITAASAPAGSVVEFQLRMGTSLSQIETQSSAIVASWDSRYLGGVYPQNDRFGGVVANLPAANYICAIYARVLSPGSVTFDNQWITAEGTPTTYPAGRATLGSTDVTVSTSWALVGPQLTVSNAAAVDLVLHSAFQAVSSAGASLVYVGYAVDGGSSGQQVSVLHIGTALPSSFSVFDSKPNVASGSHTLQMWMATDAGTATIRYAGLQYAAEPISVSAPPMVITPVAIDTVLVDPNTSQSQPQASILIGCGNWTKLLEFDVPAAEGVFNWQLEGFLDILGNLSPSNANQWGQLAIEAVHYNLSPTGQRVFDAASDMGVFSLEVKPGASPTSGEGFQFYGDSFRWGAGGGGNTIRLWVRQVTCPSVPGTFQVGRRWLSVKLLPSPGLAY